MEKPQNTDEYILTFPPETRELLEIIRFTIQEIAPNAVEVISYGMPAFKLNGILVWYAAYARHIGFYPGSNGIEAFQSKITDYKTSKGAIQFPLNKDLPLGLIKEIVAFKVEEDLKKLELKKLALAAKKKK